MPSFVDHAMSWVGWLVRFTDRGAVQTVESDSVRRIASEIRDVPPARALYLAAFAYVLGRAAQADNGVAEAETHRMVSLMQRIGHLSHEQAARVVATATEQCGSFGGTENFLVTRELRRIATREQRLELLECLFIVSASDDGISSREEAQIRQIASELGFAHHHYVAVRMSWSHERNVLRPLRGSAATFQELPPPADSSPER